MLASRCFPNEKAKDKKLYRKPRKRSPNQRKLNNAAPVPSVQIFEPCLGTPLASHAYPRPDCVHIVTTRAVYAHISTGYQTNLMDCLKRDGYYAYYGIFETHHPIRDHMLGVAVMVIPKVIPMVIP